MGEKGGEGAREDGGERQDGKYCVRRRGEREKKDVEDALDSPQDDNTSSTKGQRRSLEHIGRFFIIIIIIDHHLVIISFGQSYLLYSYIPCLNIFIVVGVFYWSFYHYLL